MAKKITLYQIFKSIHFYSAILTGVFLLLYFITGFLLVAYNWFSHETPKATTVTKSVPVPQYADAQALAKWTQQELNITGKQDWMETRQDTTRILFLTPQLRHTVLVAGNAQTVVHESRPHNVYELVSVLHRYHRYGGGFWYDVYLVAMDLTSIALVLFVITGVYLWLTIIKPKWLGWVFLILGLLYFSLVISMLKF